MPTELRKPCEHEPTELCKLREREPTDLERYGLWQDGLMFIGLFLLGVVIAKWLWGG
jgi:hypothetical protein